MPEHTVQSVQAANAAKRWGKANGYEGRSGGWIYNPKGQPVAHGWSSFAVYLQRHGIRY